ncbi:MAG: GMC family oxidoreductase [Chromatiaceae bacterium]|nr:GMC family oxidoreductase [Chromatiaceae bacterium]
MSVAAVIDLARLVDREKVAHADVCIVGAGAAGIYLAVRLAEEGLKVVLLEAGPEHCVDSSAIGFLPSFDADEYPGATLGRFFGMGGSTAKWGGLLVPHSNNDAEGRGLEANDAWFSIVKTVSENSESVLQQLGWNGSSSFSTFADQHLIGARAVLDAAGFDLTASLFLPFRRKNLTFLLRQRRNFRNSITVYYNAVAKDWGVAEANGGGAQIRRLVAVSQNSNQLVVYATQFVVAAGALESARILQEVDCSAAMPVLRKGAAVGSNLSDHLSLPVADVAPSDQADAIRLLAPRFEKGWMRSFRFLPKVQASDSPRAFCHFIFENSNPGFAVAKEVLCSLQARRRPALTAAALRSGIGGLMQLGYLRYMHSRLFIPPDTPVRLQLDVEQEAVSGNCISLGEERDRYGRRVSRINWRIRERDIERVRATAESILRKWPGRKAGLPELIARNNAVDDIKPYDAYHPVGTCRMGLDLAAVVDPSLKVWGVQNLWVASTGVLPSAGSANPTFTMLCLAEGIAGQLRKRARMAVSALRVDA